MSKTDDQRADDNIYREPSRRPIGLVVSLMLLFVWLAALVSLAWYVRS